MRNKSVLLWMSLLILFTMVVIPFQSHALVETGNEHLVWLFENGKAYWYENGVRQGTYADKNGVMGDGTIRGREIYDPVSDGWYWLDSLYDGAKAENKEVWVPYIFQGDSSWSAERIESSASLSGTMSEQVKNAISQHTGKWVRYDSVGKMYKGWYTVAGDQAQIYPDQTGNRYYYDPITGLMAKGDTFIDGIWYRFDSTTGVLVDGNGGQSGIPAVSTVTAVVAGGGGKTIDLNADLTVWLSATGDKFHRINDCGRMNPNKATPVTADYAVSHGFQACKNCFSGY